VASGIEQAVRASCSNRAPPDRGAERYVVRISSGQQSSNFSVASSYRSLVGILRYQVLVGLPAVTRFVAVAMKRRPNLEGLYAATLPKGPDPLGVRECPRKRSRWQRRKAAAVDAFTKGEEESP
jgi:hypothetical protein